MFLKKWFVAILMIAMMIPMASKAGDGGLGVKAGANFSKVGFIAGDTKFQPGMTFGLNYETKTLKFFAFQVGLDYHWKRSKAEEFNLDSLSFEDFKVGFHYIELPVTFKFYIFDWFNVNAGAYVNYLISAKGESIDQFGAGNIWNLISDDEFRDNNNDAFLGRLDFGIHFGAEFVTKSGFGFGAQYSQGFGDVTNDSFDWDVSMLNPKDKKVRTSSIITYLFYRF
ncbi:MAG: PorT family protein [Bacteroidetes bacterium]|nr:PorT family protein [Bacteroidota bacterium]